LPYGNECRRHAKDQFTSASKEDLELWIRHRARDLDRESASGEWFADRSRFGAQLDRAVVPVGLALDLDLNAASLGDRKTGRH
jgi:hypothetical protein